MHVFRDECVGRDRRKHVGSGEHRLAPERADAGAFAGRLLALDPLRLPAARGGAHELAAAHGIGSVDLPGRLEQAAAIVVGNARQQRSVGDDPLEDGGGAAEVREESRRGWRGVGCADVRRLLGGRRRGFHDGCSANVMLGGEIYTAGHA